MSDHAVLSASGSHRWLNCLPSARLELEFENSESNAAARGTAAHNLCEHKLKKALHMRSKRPVSAYNTDEMEEHSDAYVEFVMEQLELARQSCTDPLILIEQRLDFSCYVPQGFGTGDCIIIGDKKLHIIDFKYGMGVLVDAMDNPQMKLYALGALEIYDSLYDIEEVSMTIFQPRRENVSTWTIPANEIIAYATDAAVKHGKEWHGFKVVEGRSVRKYKDEGAVAEAAKANGYKDIYRQNLITLTEMQKLMGKKKFEQILGGLIHKPPGKPTLVPNSDKRPAMNISNVKNEFNEITEELEYE